MTIPILTDLQSERNLESWRLLLNGDTEFDAPTASRLMFSDPEAHEFGRNLALMLRSSDYADLSPEQLILRAVVRTYCPLAQGEATDAIVQAARAYNVRHGGRR